MVRASEVYITREIWSALNTCRSEHEPIEALAERYLRECLSRDFPGIFECLEACSTEIEQAKKKNKEKLDAWQRSLPPKPIT